MERETKNGIREILFHLINDERLTNEESRALRDLNDVWLHELIIVESMYYAAYRRQESKRPRDELAKTLMPEAMRSAGLHKTDKEKTIEACLRWAEDFLEVSGEDKTFPPLPEGD